MDSGQTALVVILMLLHGATCNKPSSGIFADIAAIHPAGNEVFLLNLEDGYFGCQVNESTDVLQLFKLSKMCDGHSHCLKGDDENYDSLKCTNDCAQVLGADCKNGVCLDSMCHCNGGWGAKNCELPDENECKLRPCDIFAHCTNTIGSFFCTCYPGYEGDGFNCKDIDECSKPEVSRCKQNEECHNLPAHYICKCAPGFESDGESDCKDIDECLNPNTCGLNGICSNTIGNYTCSCPEGYDGDPYVKCVDINECSKPDACKPGAECVNLPGSYNCTYKCPAGFTGDAENNDCRDIDECTLANACPSNSICENQPGTFSCTCIQGFEQHANQTCIDINECNLEGICGENSDCVNQEGTFSCLCGLNTSLLGGIIECRGRSCLFEEDLLPNSCSCLKNDGTATANDKMGFCTPCDQANGFRSNYDGQCICHFKTGGNSRNESGCFCEKENVRVDSGEQCGGQKYCETDLDCPVEKACSNLTRTCQNPCVSKTCGTNAYCQPDNHRATCLCPQWLTGNGDIACSVRPGRTDFPRPELTVNCLSDSIQVDIAMLNFRDSGALGSPLTSSELFYVKGHSKDPDCRKLVEHDFVEPVDFRVKFGTCGLSHAEGEASFILVVQRHPRLVTYTAQAFNIKCMYLIGEKRIQSGLNISALTTAGTITNTGPPPICLMRVTSVTGKEVTSAEIGAALLLKISVQPSSIYTGFAKNCLAKSADGDEEIEYIVTDANGCATDSGIFGDWVPEPQGLSAHFNAFKFPTGGGIKFQCDVHVCFGPCPPARCNNQPDFGRKKRESLAKTSNSSKHTTIKEEITLQSNYLQLLTIDTREDYNYVHNPIKAPKKTPKKEVCMSSTGFMVTILATALLTLITASITISCWVSVTRQRMSTTSGSSFMQQPVTCSNSTISTISSSTYKTRQLLLHSSFD